MRKPREVKFEGGVKLYKCSSCGEFLPRERYSQNLSGYDFITSECKKCNTIRIKKYRNENKEKRNEYQRNYKAKRRMMMEAQFGEGYKVVPIPEPTYPQPEPVPAVVSVNFDNRDITLTPSINEKPVITNGPAPHVQSQSDGRADDSTSRTAFTFSSNFARAEKLRQENLAAAEEEAIQSGLLADDEIVIQAAIDKNPDAYTEILSDEDLLNAFNNRSVESKINELTRRQQKFDKQKTEREYNAMKEKMRDLVDETLDDEQKKHFEDKLHSLHEDQQDEFVKKVSKLSKASFPVSREAIFDAQLDIQTGKIKNKDVII